MYQSKLIAEFVVGHPRIWYFIQISYDVIIYRDFNVELLYYNCIGIPRPRKRGT